MSRHARCKFFVLVFAFASTAQGAPAHCIFRVHMEANVNDSSVFATPMRSAVTGKKIVIEKVARISEQDVASFYPYRGDNGSYGALLRLTEHGRLALDTLSVERRGGYVYIFVNGRPVSEMQIDKRVSDGQIYLASGLTQNDLALMGKDWRVIGRQKK